MILGTRRHLLAAGIAGLGARAAAAQEVYPSRPVTMVIPWAAGGSTDTLGRVLAQTMGNDLGQPIVVENRGGASGTVGHGHVARSRPDGYTFLIGTNSTYAIAPHLMRGMPYDNRAAFTGVSLVARSAQALCVHPSVRANDLAGFLALVRSKPGEVTFSSAGIGASSHLATELLMAKTNTRMLHVPYRGGGPSAQGLLAGEVACSFVDLVTALPFRQSGQLRLLGVSTSQRSALAMACRASNPPPMRRCSCRPARRRRSSIASAPRCGARWRNRRRGSGSSPWGSSRSAPPPRRSTATGPARLRSGAS
jgi:tripartite-type tricarboxylate transporter receptor subunit TctC